MLVGIEPGTSRSRVRCFTTAPQRSILKRTSGRWIHILLQVFPVILKPKKQQQKKKKKT